MKDYISIGKVIKPHGLNGEIKIYIDDVYQLILSDLEVVFLGKESGNSPYFVEEIRSANPLLLKLETIDSKEAATTLSNQSIFVREKDIPENLLSQELPYADLIGYTMNDKHLGVIGEIEAILEYPQQYLATILYNEKEVMIPLNGSIISSIDDDTKQIIVDLPDGLLEL